MAVGLGLIVVKNESDMVTEGSPRGTKIETEGYYERGISSVLFGLSDLALYLDGKNL